MYSESDLLPISALQHLLFCERQCALIHIERLWVENRLTIEGRHLHEKAHGQRAGPRGGGLDGARRNSHGTEVHIVRGMHLRSLTLGLFGVADVVEFHEQAVVGNAAAGADRTNSVALPFPVEYKRGRPKKHDADRVQLCAQALCLEESLHVAVPAGALFYGRTRHRESVVFDTALRQSTEQAASRLHELIASRRSPRAVYDKAKCERCSLIHLCLPDVPASPRAASRYLDRALADAAADSASGKPNR
ncbi:MAG: hypothetical protein CHACPFDD_00348 [Phycisphaerae bacterium]|nr:hypothetical protein [Phycisphaerae bacterium]